MGRGENPTGKSTNNSGDKAESWTFGKLGPTPKQGTPLSEGSSNPCMAETERLPQREHSMDSRGKPPCPARVLWVGSSVFWSSPGSSPPRRTPSLFQEQQRERERETGE